MKHSTWGLAGLLAASVIAVPAGAGEVSDRPVDDVIMEAAASHAVSGARSGDVEVDRIIQGSKIAPVPLTFNRRNQEIKNLVYLGSYIVNAQGGCNDCHTNPPYEAGHDPFLGEPAKVNAAGYLAGGTAFGPFTSRNLTPKGVNRRPEGNTFEQFKEIMRTGHDLKERHPESGPLLQVMPWPVYGNMTDHDLLAIYTYLSAIPSIDNDN
jgi:hypothetical protein